MPARILVVEDDPDIAELVTRYLDKAGFVSERAASGREALTAIAGRLPDLLVLDLMLPHVDGLEVCRLIRGNHIVHHAVNDRIRGLHRTRTLSERDRNFKRLSREAKLSTCGDRIERSSRLARPRLVRGCPPASA